MFSNTPFYYNLTRKYVVLFGNLFNNITILKKNRDDNTEIERFKVPIIYAPKEKYFTRLQSDIDLQKEVQVILPRMSFEMTRIEYDSSRKINSLYRNPTIGSDNVGNLQYSGVPYNLSFELQIYSRNIDDGLQIIEQILPYFGPDYTITVNTVQEMGFLKDIPVVMNGISNSIEHEGNYDSVRYVTWSLSFTMKTYFFGPVQKPKIIRKVITNIYNDPSLVAGYIVRINTGGGNNGSFKIDDIVYSGNTYNNAEAYGQVLSWNKDTGRLVLGATQGTFKINTRINALDTNASYNIVSFDVSPLKLAKITIEPDPIDAEPTDDYGFTTEIKEFPFTD